MPIPSVDPIPLPPTLSRFADPDDAQDASYLAASARMASFSRVSSRDMRSLYVPHVLKSSAKEASGCGVAIVAAWVAARRSPAPSA
jgi:hypothetical protein